MACIAGQASAQVVSLEMIPPVHTFTCHLKRAASPVPTQLCVAASRIILNCLPTARRMQGLSAPYPLCDANAGDDVADIVSCTCFIGLMSFERWLGAPPGTAALAARRATLPAPSIDAEICATTICNECLVHSYSIFKRDAAELIPAQVMRARLRQLEIRCRALWRLTRARG